MSSPTHLEKGFAFYAAYHSDKTNQLIHICCVWPILFTAQIFLTYTPAVYGSYNWAAIFSLLYIIYYALIEQPGLAGPFAGFLVWGGFNFAMYAQKAFPECWKIALVVHVGCWAAQIYGHQVHEGRAPAFLDNLVQAFLMAPLFVLLEVMFKFGYKPDFHKRANAIASKNIAEFRHARAEEKRAKKD